jgi:hypothetical protein
MISQVCSLFQENTWHFHPCISIPHANWPSMTDLSVLGLNPTSIAVSEIGDIRLASARHPSELSVLTRTICAPTIWTKEQETNDRVSVRDRDVNLSVLCLRYQILFHCPVCLFRAWKGDRTDRQTIGRPNVVWNSGVDKPSLMNCWHVNWFVYEPVRIEILSADRLRS